ncbi:hypothetical protein HMI54_008877 [Coelomomyces lativittatus]|nr:hypothetical protein HMI54_008877 [Coelomomyces lativittatus]
MERHRHRHHLHPKHISTSEISRSPTSISDYTTPPSSITSSPPTSSSAFQNTSISTPSLPSSCLSSTPYQSSSTTHFMDLSPLDPYFHKYFSRKLGIFYSELRVLLILESSSEATHLSTLLKNSGYPLVDYCKNLSEAFHLLRTNSSFTLCTTYSFILCDCVLAQETLQLLRSLPSLSYVPFIAIASQTQLEVAGTILLLGAEDCLFRPLSVEMTKGLWKHIWRKKRTKYARRVQTLFEFKFKFRRSKC